MWTCWFDLFNSLYLLFSFYCLVFLFGWFDGCLYLFDFSLWLLFVVGLLMLLWLGFAYVVCSAAVCVSLKRCFCCLLQCGWLFTLMFCLCLHMLFDDFGVLVIRLVSFTCDVCVLWLRAEILFICFIWLYVSFNSVVICTYFVLFICDSLWLWWIGLRYLWFIVLI